MLFSTAVRRGVRSTINNRNALMARNASTTTAGKNGGVGIPPNVLRAWYNVFGKSNIAYITWIVGGVLVGELVCGYGIDSLWSSVNSGRTYDQIDWTKFKVEDDDDDEDDEDEEEEGEGDDEEEEDDE